MSRCCGSQTKGLTLKPLPLGESEKVSVGSPVAAIGSPFGQAQSLSVGIVSAVDRSVASLTDFAIAGAIQTDAAINPGNSGGPLVGADGRVIGINQQIQSRSGGGEGVGFAVPIDVVKRSIGQLREEGRARYAYLGVSSVPLYPQLVQHFGLKVDKGVWVQQVTPGGPAAKAGLRGGNGQEAFQGQPFARGGDVITKVGDAAITNSDDLAKAIAKFKPGQEADVEVHRGGRDQDAQSPRERRSQRACPLLGRLESSRTRCSSLPPRSQVRIGCAPAGYRQSHGRATAPGPGLQPRTGDLSGRRIGQARHRRARDGPDRPRFAP